jgi:ATP synthase I chain
MIVVAGGVAGALGGAPAGWSAAAGALAALLGTLVLTLREKQSERHLGWSAARNLLQLYRSGLERFVLMAAVLGLLFAYSRAVPVAVLAGFSVAQAAWLLAFL